MILPLVQHRPTDANPPEIRDGFLHLSQEPGWGLVLDKDIERELRAAA